MSLMLFWFGKFEKNIYICSELTKETLGMW